MSEPLHIISLGAGVQSSTMALMAAAGEIAPMPQCAIFADTQAEPASVYGWLDWLEGKLPFPVHRVSKGSLSESALRVRISKAGNSYTNSNVPAFLKSPGVDREGVQRRQCTKDFKIDVILQKARHLAKSKISAWRPLHAEPLALWRAYNKEKAAAKKEGRKPTIPFPAIAWQDMQDSAPIVQWIGISRDEVQRMKPSRLPYIAHIWPLIDRKLTRAGCISWMKARGFPEPPRSACVFCPYHGDAEWQRLKEEEPAEFERAAQFEDAYTVTLSQIQRRTAVPFLHRSMLPLRTVDFVQRLKDKADQQHPDMFQNECEGMCGV